MFSFPGCILIPMDSKKEILPTFLHEDLKREVQITEGSCGENWICTLLSRKQKVVVKYPKKDLFLDELVMWTDVCSCNSNSF
jgi:hypothetical protein